MILLFDPMSLILPEIGYVFWTFLAFVFFWAIAGKFAIKPIVNSIETRNQKIEDELLSAQKARQEFEELKAQNADFEKQAREERQKLFAEAKADAELFRASELKKAKEDAVKMLESAKSDIEGQKNAALNEVRKEVGLLSVSIAEKLLQDKLATTDAQTSLVNKLVNESLANN